MPQCSISREYCCSAALLLVCCNQIGVAFGIAVLSTVSIAASADRMPDALNELYGAREAGDAEQVASAQGALFFAKPYSGEQIIRQIRQLAA